MGCMLNGPAKTADVAPIRRRLSLGEISDSDNAVQSRGSVEEESRCMLLELKNSDVLDFVKDGRPKSYKIGTDTDPTLHRAQSFSQKTVNAAGTVFQNANESIGYACKKGLKPEAPNQDSFIILKVANRYSIYGVFDGHGKHGHDISNFVKENLPKLLLRQEMLETDPLKALEITFAQTQHLIEQSTYMGTIDAVRSGTTASVILHNLETRMLYMAHVGDSRCVLGRMDDQKEVRSLDLTTDHKPNLPEERERIIKNGGVVLFDGGWNYRVYAKDKKDERGKRYPGLNMSRSMGDMNGVHNAGISPVPDVSTRVIHQETPEDMLRKSSASSSSLGSHASVSSHQLDPEVDKFLLLCSDGIWEFITSQQAVEHISGFKHEDAMAAAESLASKSWKLWVKEMEGQVVDDITAIVVYFDGVATIPHDAHDEHDETFET